MLKKSVWIIKIKIRKYARQQKMIQTKTRQPGLILRGESVHFHFANDHFYFLLQDDSWFSDLFKMAAASYLNKKASNHVRIVILLSL